MYKGYIQAYLKRDYEEWTNLVAAEINEFVIEEDLRIAFRDKEDIKDYPELAWFVIAKVGRKKYYIKDFHDLESAIAYSYEMIEEVISLDYLDKVIFKKIKEK